MTEQFSVDYRQGFLTGYQRAFENLNALLDQEQYDLENVREICRAFWTNELSDWLETGGDIPVLYLDGATEQVVTTVEHDAVPADPYEDKTP